jgi:putative holliday junction resolvase
MNHKLEFESMPRQRIRSSVSPDSILGIDFGDRRVGIASGSLEMKLAHPLEVVDRLKPGADLITRIRELAHERKVGVIVVGDPVNMDGTVGPRSEISREFARLLKRALRQVQVILYDERLSSFSADEWMERDGIKPARRKEMRDAYAAAVILQDFIDGIGKEAV